MILFIEDDIMLSEEISEFLKENDFEVEVVGNGDDALKLLQSRIYDLCILDIGLPDCSGFLLYSFTVFPVYFLKDVPK